MNVNLEPKLNRCRVCFNEIKDHSLFNLFNKNNIICEECFSKLKVEYREFYIGEIKVTTLYEYNQEMRELIYKFKGCYDIEMGEVFLSRYLWYLKLRYRGYVIVPLPSYYLEDERRGFNHVVEIFSRLELPIEKVIKKTKESKQAKKRKKERLKAIESFGIENIEKINNKKVLIVDDVYTTGSSLRAAITLVRKGKPKTIECLVVAKKKTKKRK